MKDTSLIMQDLGKTVSDKLPKGFNFFLFVAPVGDDEGRANYVSTIERECAIKCMKEFIIKCGHEEDWMKHL